MQANWIKLLDLGWVLDNTAWYGQGEWDGPGMANPLNYKSV